jgi:hypothetical protein
LLVTRSDEDIRKTIILHIDEEDHNIRIDKIDSNLVLENRYTTCGSQSSFDGTIANIPVKTTHNVRLDTREKMKSISNYEEEATAKPHLTSDPAHREATYSGPRPQLSCHHKCIATTRGQVHFPTMSTDLFLEISGYTQYLNHHISTTSNNAADVSKVQDSNVQAHHLVDLVHVTSGHPLTLEAQLSLGTYCFDSFDSTSSFSYSNYDLAYEPIQDT